MRTPLIFVLACLLLGTGAWAKQTNKPDLKLNVTLDTAPPERQPILIIDMINQSGHSLRIPDPPLLCAPAPGAFSLEVKFTPESGEQNQTPPSCDLEVDGSKLPDIRERAKEWLTLKSGQDYKLRRPLAMGVNTSAPGTYDMRVIYSGPSANQADAEKLQSAGIAAPNGRFESNKVSYKISEPKQ